MAIGDEMYCLIVAAGIMICLAAQQL